jgi:type IV pilus assembly protein PilW
VATTASGGTPGNCTQFLNPYLGCASVSKQGMAIEGGGIMSRLSSAGWYVGHNASGGRSLFRIGPGLAGVLEPPEEVADSVNDMQLQYLVGTAGLPGSDYVDASAVTDWDDVFAVRIVLTLESRDAGGQTLQRTLAHTVALRNRLP